ncbi:hypothetical protein PGT21_020806 [Puccinia graminis f. sp. tritici]|uniref:Uncharacterized protein n=1 Tax=Puccinia graminis f. sp. tritici TaxID=56615 RepID=A0A5B0QN69_PUCGR|nr:hypothetical protein PGT21_020806 [Puccinia graminis f. sp. tritici]
MEDFLWISPRCGQLATEDFTYIVKKHFSWGGFDALAIQSWQHASVSITAAYLTRKLPSQLTHYPTKETWKEKWIESSLAINEPLLHHMRRLGRHSQPSPATNLFQDHLCDLVVASTRAGISSAFCLPPLVFWDKHLILVQPLKAPPSPNKPLHQDCHTFLQDTYHNYLPASLPPMEEDYLISNIFRRRTMITLRASTCCPKLQIEISRNPVNPKDLPNLCWLLISKYLQKQEDRGLIFIENHNLVASVAVSLAMHYHHSGLNH